MKRATYQKLNTLPPESYEAQQRQAWQEHNNTFRPVWVELTKKIRNTSIELAEKKKPKIGSYTKSLTKPIADYIDLSRASFYHYLVELTKYYVADQLSKAEFKGSELTIAETIAKKVMKNLEQRRLPKSKKKKKKKSGRKKDLVIPAKHKQHTRKKQPL